MNMIDSEIINKLQNEALEKRIKEQEKAEKTNNEYYETNRKRRLVEMEEGKKLAEQKFPIKLKELEKDIKYQIEYEKRSTKFFCDVDNNLWATQYLQIMFAQVLPLYGMSCKIDEESIEVGW